MTQFLYNLQSARVYVIEPLVAMRFQIVEALRQLGFHGPIGYTDLNSFLDLLEVEPVDWIITAAFATTPVNVLHLLKLCAEEPRLRKVRVSLMYRESEEHILPVAFETGLMSAHNVEMPSRIPDELQDLLRIARSTGFNATLIASCYIRSMLRAKRQWNEIIKFEKALLELFPGSTETLVSIAEAQLASGDHERGMRTLQQVKLLNPALSEQVDQLKSNYAALDETGDLFDDQEPLDKACPEINALGIQAAILADPDSAVQQSVRQVMTATGVQNLEVFDSGQKAWNWISNGRPPNLIFMEWRTIDLTGAQLIQRVRQKFTSVPVIVISSLVSQSEVPLVKEMGVNAVVEKPFDNATLLAEIITVLQQQQYPTEQVSMDRKIIQCLQLGNKAEAKRLIGIYLSHPDYDDSGKRRIEAEYAFYEGQYTQCCALASTALKQSTDSLELLNLLGKALMKLGDFESALKCMTKAQSLSPANIERACRMASLCAELGDIENAEHQLLQAKKIDAGNTMVLETEAQLALGSGNAERAAQAMASLESLHRIVAFINNKAVALVRNHKFEEGIALYKSALEALPPPWGHAHDTVCYNLSLAHIRFSEYENALQSLEKVKAGSNTAIGKKAHSLRQKILHAQQTNTHLTISVEAKELNAPQDPKAQVQPEIDFAALVDGIAASQGDICCYRIFSSDGMASEESIKLFQKAPKLKQRRPAS